MTSICLIKIIVPEPERTSPEILNFHADFSAEKEKKEKIT